MIKRNDLQSHNIITSDLYAGSNIEKAYGGLDIATDKIYLETLEGSRETLKKNLEKGSIDQPLYDKAVEQLENLIEKASKKGEGSKGGHIIGHTKSGKPVYKAKSAGHKDHKDFSGQDHLDAAHLHAQESMEHRAKYQYATHEAHVKLHHAMMQHHSSAADSHRQVAAGIIKKEYEANLSEDERKIIDDQNKKKIDHHEKMRDFHQDIARYISEKHSDNPDHIQAKNYHIEQAQHHHMEFRNAGGIFEKE